MTDDPNKPAEYPAELLAAARELTDQGLTPRDVDAALRLPPGFAAGLIAERPAR